ncbi:5'/3'-nucleotidase SurE [Minwuia thermotolerans]|uniref:5'-nucleotidase SurE n=1 Tax=Minwuia thermotolerans TaxID=2056226 RepID=A0A2M9G2Z7_9PROT|nr:5'/3'-nucleotidase SurE [Minwuia thermotolerans]PJK30078.1 5'/3'-nucleotidase SurE [Minwuia thermotolerans]
MKILLTNDDGIHAPGLKTLENIARELTDDIWIVAPAHEQSGAGHSLSLTNPLRMQKLDDRRFAVAGTPTDCVMMALRKVVQGVPDLVLSGVNRGANLAEDVTYSGTVAAAMEATLLGVPSIALSQVGYFGQDIRWQTAERHAPDIIRKLVDKGWPADVLMNVNFPDVEPDDVKGVHVVPHGRRDQSDITIDARVDGRNVPYFWIGLRRQRHLPEPGTDIGVIWREGISVTPISLDLTDPRSLAEMGRVFGD